MKINWLTITLLFLLVLNASMFGTFLYRQDKAESDTSIERSRDFQRIGNNPQRAQYFRDALEFTPGQQERFRDIRREFHRDGHQLRKQLKTLNQKFLDELTSSSPDSIRILALTEEIGAVHADLKLQSYRYYSAMRELCNPEQVEKLDSLILRNIDEDMYLRKHGPRQRHKWK